jgi:hypothetical protein
MQLNDAHAQVGEGRSTQHKPAKAAQVTIEVIRFLISLSSLGLSLSSVANTFSSLALLFNRPLRRLSGVLNGDRDHSRPIVVMTT